MPQTAPPTAVRVFSPAKLNWVLEILGRRADGFHELDTVFQALDHGDVLTLRTAPHSACTIQCDWPGVPTGAENLVARAWRLLAAAYPAQARGVDCHIAKRLPPCGGLAGGSSNAAAMLLGLSRLWNLTPARAALAELAAELGSDCPFFLYGGAARARGRGERLQPIPNRLPPLWVVVVCPDFPSATAAAYRLITPAQYTDGTRAGECAHFIEKGDLKKFQGCLYNAFTAVVSEANPSYRTVYDLLKQAGMDAPVLAGSGSSLFSVTPHQPVAEQRLAVLHPRYRASFLARPIAGGVRLLPAAHSPLDGNGDATDDGTDSSHHLPGVSQPE